jgi:hypothetical protein
MTEAAKSERRPRRDADGRLATFPDLIGTAVAGLLTGFVVLVVIEGLLSLIRLSEFGNASGWIALVLPVWLFSEEFRKAGWGATRIVVGLLGLGFGVAAGMTLAGVVAGIFPPLISGAVGAFALTVVYSAVWFYGLRYMRDRAG